PWSSTRARTWSRPAVGYWLSGPTNQPGHHTHPSASQPSAPPSAPPVPLPRMQGALGVDPVGWCWVTAMFTLSYCLFEIPTGTLGDRIGPRRVLTRVVLWWSVFTSLTGMVSNYAQLLIARFCFGAGEAAAFPNASIVVARWFPATQRARRAGVMLMASKIGGAIAPLLVVPIQIRYGWRASFYVFG